MKLTFLKAHKINSSWSLLKKALTARLEQHTWAVTLQLPLFSGSFAYLRVYLY